MSSEEYNVTIDNQLVNGEISHLKSPDYYTAYTDASKILQKLYPSHRYMRVYPMSRLDSKGQVGYYDVDFTVYSSTISKGEEESNK